VVSLEEDGSYLRIHLHPKRAASAMSAAADEEEWLTSSGSVARANASACRALGARIRGRQHLPHSMAAGPLLVHARPDNTCAACSPGAPGQPALSRATATRWPRNASVVH
jgi:hypothetical protein